MDGQEACEKVSTSLIIREIQIKLQGSITSHWSEWPSSENHTNNKC